MLMPVRVDELENVFIESESDHSLELLKFP